MQGYRTIVAAAFQVIIGVLTMLGVTVSEETAATLRENAETIIGSVLIIAGIVQAWLRALTTGPSPLFGGGTKPDQPSS